MRFSKLVPVALALFATSTSGRQLSAASAPTFLGFMNDGMKALRTQVQAIPETENPHHVLINGLVKLKHDLVDAALAFGKYDPDSACQAEGLLSEEQANVIIAEADKPDGPLRNCEHLFYEIYYIYDQLQNENPLCLDALLGVRQSPIDALRVSIAAILRSLSDLAAVANMDTTYSNLGSWFPEAQKELLQTRKSGCEFNLRAAAEKWANPPTPPPTPEVTPENPPARKKRCLGFSCQA